MSKDTKANFTFALERWTMREFREWSKLIGQEEPDYDRMAELASKAIVAWPYQENPAVSETWEMIDVVRWATVLNALKIAVENLFSQGK